MKGFSLVELLVAMAALSLLAVGSVFLTGYAMDARETIETRELRTGELVRLQAALSFDLTQAASRRARAEDGSKPQTALQGRSLQGEGSFLSLVRRGANGLVADDRPDVQSVEYRIEAGVIERRSRRFVDGAPPASTQPLLTGVRAVTLSYLEGDEWVSGWPGSPERPLPRAVRLRIDLGPDGDFDQLFLIPGGGA